MRFAHLGKLYTTSLALLGLTAAVALPVADAHAQTVINGSFEANSAAFTTFPGYVNAGNPSIDSWISNNGNSGLNNEGGTGNRFANNGGKPDGPTVAFLQVQGAGTTSISQAVSGFVAGQQYNVEFLLNQRLLIPGVDPATPGLVLNVTADATNIYSSEVPAAGAYNNIVSSTFTATASTVTITFAASNPNGGDSTALLDNIRVNSLTVGTAAPEPGSLALLIPAGLGVVGMVRRRRK